MSLETGVYAINCRAVFYRGDHRGSCKTGFLLPTMMRDRQFMNRLPALAAATALLFITRHAAAVSDIHDCQIQSGGSYAYMEACMNKRFVERMAARKAVTHSVDPVIVSYCRSEAGDNRARQDACIHEEEQAEQRISQMRVSGEIHAYCRRAGKKSFALMENCIQHPDAQPLAVGVVRWLRRTEQAASGCGG